MGIEYMLNGLPNRIFFTGVPGSKWSGIAQVIESIKGMNTTDRTSERQYNHSKYSGHKGAYFGKGMEFPAILDDAILDTPHLIKKPCRLLKSHEWSYVLDQIKNKYPDDWIILVYRPSNVSFEWWNRAGGFDITYPNYSSYKGIIFEEIQKQNKNIINFAKKNKMKWENFTPNWIENNFGQYIEFDNSWNDVMITIKKNG